MKNVTIDCFGNRNDRATARFNTPAGKKRPYLVDEAGNGVTYICFDNTPKRAIHRVTEYGGVAEVVWAFGAWENRANLTYTATPSDVLTVAAEDVEG